MTIQLCLSICRSKNHQFAGLQWQNECYCGDEPKRGFAWAWPEKCNERCAGNSDQICGGSNSISLWKVPSQSLDGICVYNSPTRLRILPDLCLKGLKELTIEKCRTICEGKSLICFELINSICSTRDNSINSILLFQRDRI